MSNVFSEGAIRKSMYTIYQTKRELVYELPYLPPWIVPPTGVGMVTYMTTMIDMAWDKLRLITAKNLTSYGPSTMLSLPMTDVIHNLYLDPKFILYVKVVPDASRSKSIMETVLPL